jgi:hypothetical protein
MEQLKKLLEKIRKDGKIDGIGTITVDDGNDVLLYSDESSVFGFQFLQLIKLFEKKYEISEAMLPKQDTDDTEKEKRLDYRLKRVVLIFSNQKGDVKRTVIVKDEKPPRDNEQQERI